MNCIIDTTKKLNKDGYLRVRYKGGLKFKHRIVWEECNGPVPSGKEIHHACNNRACYNIEHLCCIGISEHKSLSNKQRKGTGYFKAQRKRDHKGQFTNDVH